MPKVPEGLKKDADRLKEKIKFPPFPHLVPERLRRLNRIKFGLRKGK